MASKKSIKPVHRKLMELLREMVLERDNYTCQKCGKKVEGRNAHLSHVKSKGRNKHLQYDPINLKILCYHCHIYWWHKEPTEAGEWFRRKFPDRYKYLEEKALEIPYNFMTKENLECILKDLRSQK